jgi:hypothetical protein
MLKSQEYREFTTTVSCCMVYFITKLPRHITSEAKSTNSDNEIKKKFRAHFILKNRLFIFL